MRGRPLYAALLPLAFSLLLLSCGQPFERQANLALVPRTSTLCVHLAFPPLQSQPALALLVTNSGLPQVASQLGIPLKDIREACSFICPTSGSSLPGSAVLISGDFRTSELLSTWIHGGWVKGRRSGVEVFTHSGTSTLVVPMGQHTVALADPTGLDLIEKVLSGDIPSVLRDPEVSAMAQQVNSPTEPVGVLVRFGQVAQDTQGAALAMAGIAAKAFNLEPVASILERIGAAKGFACCMEQDGNQIRTTILALMASEESASFLAGSLNILSGLTGIAKSIQPPQANSNPQPDLEVTRRACLVTILLTVDKSFLLNPPSSQHPLH